MSRIAMNMPKHMATKANSCRVVSCGGLSAPAGAAGTESIRVSVGVRMTRASPLRPLIDGCGLCRKPAAAVRNVRLRLRIHAHDDRHPGTQQTLVLHRGGKLDPHGQTLHNLGEI